MGMNETILQELNYRLSKLEDKVFGTPKGHKIKMSAQGENNWRVRHGEILSSWGQRMVIEKIDEIIELLRH